MPGPSKTPRHLKLLRGTLQPCRDVPAGPGLPELDSVSPPHWLQDVTAVAEFKRLAAVLAVNRLLTTGNVAILAHVCMLHARISATWTAGGTPTAALLAIFRKLSADLGLTHLPTPAPADKPNRFLLNGKRR